MVRAVLNWTEPGVTVTPEEVAHAMHAHPAVANEVRRLAAANLVAVAVPFHRLQEVDGTSPYYRWGEERRQAVLTREAGAMVWWL